MKALLSILLTLLCGHVLAQSEATNSANVRFEAVDVFVDAGETAFAAYQLTFSVTNTVAKIVGIEGGEHSAFREAPYYDPKAMQQERVILAAFTTQKDLPKGKTRVATIHLQVVGNAAPQPELKLELVADSAGKKISAKANFEMRAKK